MIKSEAHVFIVWSKGLEQRAKILTDIKSKFEIIKSINTTWSKNKFSENLSRFYGENLPKNSSKEKHCGTGTFLCIIVKDNNPQYELRETSKGIKPVNINMFDAKQCYRKWTGGGHKIHGSDNVSEAKSNIYLLFGTTYENVLTSKEVGVENSYANDLIGSQGWESLEEVFSAFNELANYVVLRNFTNIEDELKNLHPDIDILTDNKRLLVDISNGKPTYKDPKRVQYLVIINKQKVFFDFRFIGDNYYDFKWEQKILGSRRKLENMFIPDEENHFYSLMYHAFIHKEKVISDYVMKLIELSKKNGMNYSSTSFLNYDVLKDLNAFMMINNYDYVEPRDLTVFYNNKIIEPFKHVLLTNDRKSHEDFRAFKNLIKKVFKKLGIKLGK
ncbi:hypothetical protein I2486_08060 [Cellulophaga sp. E16_2]|uniref:hypothetical protein n=1 Tax=unclassified Cellulophaga TaxID=2634405 RepID=UPI0013FDAAB7|nr:MULTISPECIES: hypothetical protein [unclassified Cellulophaga]MBO0591361.1 hypothetical protein [Cellulophaga sp. E16_2]